MTLTKQLAKSPYAEDLFPITSMNTIIISQTPEFEMDREVLAIDYNFEKEYFTLEFRQQQFNQPYDPNKRNWKRYCPPEMVYSVIVKFFRLQKWFTEFPD